AITTLLSFFVNATPNKKLIDYSYFEQIKDILPSLLISVVMFVCVVMLGTLKLNVLALVLIQVVIGMVLYFVLSEIFKIRPYQQIKSLIKNKTHKAKESNVEK
ncbi:MAG: polysaccharide biosynthesis C-terminal domain-containing protein, partial [Clostridia bacterium]|nr:polysaccharide biosynthesis C-terminal domain-containing protein [Clostridia bacterium]